MAIAERVKAVESKTLAGAPSKDLDQLMQWLQDAENATPETEFRTVSEEDYRFYAGDQDTAEVKEKLEDQSRPATVYNEVKPKIDMLIGLAGQMHSGITVVPVGREDEALSELGNGTFQHYRKKLKLPRLELECFEHKTKSGRSLLYFYIDKSNPFKPQIKATRFAGHSFYLDSDSQEYDLSDSRYLFLEKWLSEAEIKIFWPTFDISQATSTIGSSDKPSFFNEVKNKYRVVEGWYYKYDPAYWFVNPLTKEQESLSPRDFKKFSTVLKEGNEELELIPQEPPEYISSFSKNLYYMLFCGNTELEGGKSPYNWKSFPGILWGAYKDHDTNAWFGAIKMMKAPQEALNTERRQLVHLLQTLPKGILAHEVNAILDIEEYEQHGSEPNFHLELAKGAIDKFKFITQPQISPIYSLLDSTFIQAIKDASGVQDPLMGVHGTSREPGVTLRGKQESGLAVLHTLYKNAADSRLEGGRLLLSLIKQYVTEKESIRIQGEKGAQLIKINSQINPQVEGFNDISALEFDLEVDESIETASTRAITAEILADYARNNPDTIPPDIIMEYSNMPFTVKQQVKSYNERRLEAENEQSKFDRSIEDRKVKVLEEKVEVERIKAKNSNKEGGN